MAPLALVYRGRATSPGCADAVTHLLRASEFGFHVAWVGPREEYPLSATSLAQATLYAQPGGGDLAPAWRRMRKHAPAIRAYVEAGGRYLGFCLGAYLAGRSPGFALLEGDTDQYIRTPYAEWGSEEPTTLEVDWVGQRRRLYFQDGCWFDAGSHTQVLARYRNGLPAAVVNPFGAGRVGAVGPHPEATDDWFIDDGLQPVTPPTLDLGLDLVRRLMR